MAQALRLAKQTLSKEVQVLLYWHDDFQMPHDSNLSSVPKLASTIKLCVDVYEADVAWNLSY